MLRVLLVEDEMIIVEGMKKIIDWGESGFEIAASAANGEQAVSYLKDHEVDLIITDIKMPLMNGIELLEKVRDEGISNAYFVILSGYSDFEYTQKAIRGHCTDYILKPLRPEELCSLLAKIRGLHSEAACPHTEAGDVPHGVLADVEREIASRYAENLTLKELGTKFYINSAYLGQIFHKKYEISFKDYLNQYRMEKAAGLLIHTDLRVYEIAEAVGCKSLNYFINRFIEAMDCTPATYRKRMAGKRVGQPSLAKTYNL